MNEQEIENMISEQFVRKNRLERYWNRLVFESIRVACERKIDVLNSNEPLDGEVPGRIYLYKNGNYDDSSLIRLAKERLPSLYRRYRNGLQRYEESNALLEII